MRIARSYGDASTRANLEALGYAAGDLRGGRLMVLEIGVLHVRRSVWLRATPTRVWDEFASTPRLAVWFGLGHTLEGYDPGEGGRIDLSVEIDGERRAFGGRIVVSEPGRELSFENNWSSPHDWPQPTYITIRLTPLYEGTLVELFHHGFERLGSEAGEMLEGFEVGWGMNHLTALREVVEG
jgi:uncharacterized protein YndB with AHSA1/START domain